MHWSHSNPNEDLRGKVIIEFGKPALRNPRQKTECDRCNKVFEWTADNRATYNRWKMHKAGIDTGKIDSGTAWNFLRLEETAQKIAHKEKIQWQAAGY